MIKDRDEDSHLSVQPSFTFILMFLKKKRQSLGSHTVKGLQKISRTLHWKPSKSLWSISSSSDCTEVSSLMVKELHLDEWMNRWMINPRDQMLPPAPPHPSSHTPPAHCKLCETLSFTLCSHLGADSGCCFTQREDGDVLSSVQPVDGQFGAGGPFHHGHVVLTTKHKGGGG